MRRAQPWLGTLVEIDVDAADADAGRFAIDAAFARVASIHAAMSYHAPTSELCCLNRAAPGQAIMVGDDLWAVLATASRLHAESAGLFDCAVAPTLVRAGLLPMSEDIDACCGTQADVELLEPGVVRKRCLLHLDLGGIAKGYAVDAAVVTLMELGITAGTVNAGGDLRVFGPMARRILVRDPRAPTHLVPLIDLEASALATSAGYFVEPGMDGPRAALVDPILGRCIATAASISVVAPTCMIADALTKVVALSGDVRHPLVAASGAEAVRLAAATGPAGPYPQAA